MPSRDPERLVDTLYALVPKDGSAIQDKVRLLDTDYDERSLFPRQVFLPLAGAKDGWNKLCRDIRAQRAELNEDLLQHFQGTVSLVFEAGKYRKVAVKIVDDRGIESPKILELE